MSPAPPSARAARPARLACRSIASRSGAHGLTLLAMGAILGLGGCTDPEQEDAIAYVAAMQPVLVDNMGMTRQFVEIATEVKKGQVLPKSVARRFEQDMVPLATTLSDQVSAIHPTTPQLATTHQGLVDAWTSRVDVYTELNRAWTQGDLKALDAATYRNLKIKAAEEQYFTAVNDWLEPHQLALDQYP